MVDIANRKEWDPMMTQVHILDAPIKVTGEPTITPEAVRTQVEHAKEALVAIDYATVRGTCIDERERVGLKNGEPSEPRPSVPGGPNIFGLYVTELSGYFPKESALTAKQRLGVVTKDLNSKGIHSGAHEHCAANAKIGEVIGSIANNPEGVTDYAESQLGDDFDESAMAEVIAHAQEVKASGRYDGWTEAEVADELGDEAGAAIEQLADVPHQATTLIRNKIPDMTIDQTQLHNTAGQDSFIQDDAYADRIENALATGPDPVRMAVGMRHAREAILAGVAGAVPNPELHQANLA
jgi:hypothetical protein